MCCTMSPTYNDVRTVFHYMSGLVINSEDLESIEMEMPCTVTEQGVTNEFSASMRFVRKTFIPIPKQYRLVITGGVIDATSQSTGLYYPGEKVTIRAISSPLQRFESWSSNASLQDVVQSTTVLTMPARDAYATALFVDIPPEQVTFSVYPHTYSSAEMMYTSSTETPYQRNGIVVFEDDVEVLRRENHRVQTAVTGSVVLQTSDWGD